MSMIICDNCGYQIEPKIITIHTRAIDRSKQVFKQYFICPKCKAEYTVLITDPELVRLIRAGKKAEAKLYETELRVKYLVVTEKISE